VGNFGARVRQPNWYYDSFGNVVPADPGAIAAGVYPPPLPSGVTAPGTPGAPPPSGCGNFTYVTDGYNQPNILLIMVDQMRFPRWLTSAQQSTFITKIMPNLYGSTGLVQQSTKFPNYFVAANACTPSRSTLLTGLYSQQTCMFVTQDTGGAPSLQPYNGGSGFPTIGDVLSQELNIGCNAAGGLSTPYDTAWIGKWHLSDFLFNGAGSNGPSDYGFSSPFNIPNPANGFAASTYPNTAVGYPSPNGTPNEGGGGDTLGNTTAPWVPGFVYNTSATPADPSIVQGGTLDLNAAAAPFYQLSDAAIYHAFKEHWLQAHPNTSATPWFLGLSFVNPHDITFFPYAYGLGSTCGGLGTEFNCATSPQTSGYYPPPVLGWTDSYDSTEPIQFNGLPWTFYNAAGTLATGLPPSDWNNGDDPESLPYKNAVTNKPGGKPGLQAFFENSKDENAGPLTLPRVGARS